MTAPQRSNWKLADHYNVCYCNVVCIILLLWPIKLILSKIIFMHWVMHFLYSQSKSIYLSKLKIYWQHIFNITIILSKPFSKSDLFNFHLYSTDFKYLNTVDFIICKSLCKIWWIPSMQLFYIFMSIFVTLTMWIDKSHKNHFVYAREKAVTPVNP